MYLSMCITTGNKSWTLHIKHKEWLSGQSITRFVVKLRIPRPQTSHLLLTWIHRNLYVELTTVLVICIWLHWYLFPEFGERKNMCAYQIITISRSGTGHILGNHIEWPELITIIMLLECFFVVKAKTGHCYPFPTHCEC
jgi:hypothetical protein